MGDKFRGVGAAWHSGLGDILCGVGVGAPSGAIARWPVRLGWVYWVSWFACGGPAEPTVREPPVVKQN